MVVHQRRIRIEGVIEVRVEHAIMILIDMLPTVIDSRTTLLVLYATCVTHRIDGCIFRRIGIDERYAVEGDRNNLIITRAELAQPVSLRILARHILNHEELIKLVMAANIRHLNH